MIKKIFFIFLVILLHMSCYNNSTFFGMQLESHVVRNISHDVDCAVVSGFIFDENVCMCVVDMDNFNSTFVGFAILQVDEQMCQFSNWR